MMGKIFIRIVVIAVVGLNLSSCKLFKKKSSDVSLTNSSTPGPLGFFKSVQYTAEMLTGAFVSSDIQGVKSMVVCKIVYPTGGQLIIANIQIKQCRAFCQCRCPNISNFVAGQVQFCQSRFG